MPSYTERLQAKLPHVRLESEVFSELEELCNTPGFSYVIAELCLRYHTIMFSDELEYEDIMRQNTQDSLLRAEISTLICLMLKGDRWFEDINRDRVSLLCKKAGELLLDLHASIWTFTQSDPIDPSLSKEKIWLKEAIFYAGESASCYQYKELAKQRYSREDEWLVENQGFTSTQATHITNSLHGILNNKLSFRFPEGYLLQESIETVLPCFSFTQDELVVASGESVEVVAAFLNAFTFELSVYLDCFKSTADFNPVDSCPIVKCQSGFILFQFTSLAAAIYESPFYWIVKDENYKKQFIENRGRFTEEMSAERLERVFGRSRVFRNVLIQAKKNTTVGEIDVLVIYGDRLIVLQAKSKQLTQKAKEGNAAALDRDFSYAVQKSYDQAFSCAQALLNTNHKFISATGDEIELREEIKEIYPVCVISDHDPSLNAQADRYLNTQQTKIIQPPYVMDVFFLDVITEFLDNPLHFLSYLNLRVHNRDSVVSDNEMAIFTMHLTAGLRHFRSDKDPLVVLDGHTAAPVEIALMVRREGLPGKDTPEGILTIYKDTYYEKLINEINGLSDPTAISLGFYLLQLSSQEKDNFNQCFTEMLRRAKTDGQQHDFSMASEGSIGVTFHFHDWEYADARDMLYQHCESRKYRHKKDTWIGLCISPTTEMIRFGINLDFPWKKSSTLEQKTKRLLSPNKPQDLRTVVQSITKTGRNEKCFCGSGKKYKVCCI